MTHPFERLALLRNEAVHDGNWRDSIFIFNRIPRDRYTVLGILSGGGKCGLVGSETSDGGSRREAVVRAIGGERPVLKPSGFLDGSQEGLRLANNRKTGSDLKVSFEPFFDYHCMVNRTDWH